MTGRKSLIQSRDRVLLVALVARLIRLRDAVRGKERNEIDRELNAVRRVLRG